MKEYSLLKDVSTLTTIPITCLNQLSDRATYCICDCIEDTTLAGETVADIDLGIGNLQIQNIDNNVQYRFVPNSALEQGVKDTLINNKNPLVKLAENTFVRRIIDTYKDYI